MAEKYAHNQQLEGEVENMDSFSNPDCFADISLKDGFGTTFEKIEINRLMSARVAYIGARFHYIIKDEGAIRTITIEPNIEANKKYWEKFNFHIKFLNKDEDSTS
jgi:hypothetical protein